MYAHLLEWLGLLLRWVHIIAGIAWIGSSFFFMWLDSALEAPEKEKPDVTGELWMTHSGGFYQVEKRKIGPGQLPKVLHWFKWEAFFTWLSGIFLLLVVYYFTGGIYLVDSTVSDITPGFAVALGIGLILVSWIVYDFLFSSRFSKHTRILSAFSFVLLCVVTWVLTQYLSGRAAYIHVGAILGTLMVANVWMRILPAQRKMIAATERGEKPDFSLGERAKTRSVHNNYMTFPVIFIMFSNHYPSTYGHPHNWLVLVLIIIAGAGVKHVMNVGKEALWIFTPVVVLVAILVIMTAPKGAFENMRPAVNVPAEDAVSFETVTAIVTSRCLPCHSQHPTDATFGAAPAGVSFDDVSNITKFASRIHARVVDFKTMPLANKTQMTEEERRKISLWYIGGAKSE